MGHPGTPARRGLKDNAVPLGIKAPSEPGGVFRRPTSRHQNWNSSSPADCELEVRRRTQGRLIAEPDSSLAIVARATAVADGLLCQNTTGDGASLQT